MGKRKTHKRTRLHFDRATVLLEQTGQQRG